MDTSTGFAASREPAREPAAERVREEWRVDPAESSLTFKLRHLIVSSVEGHFRRWGGRVLITRGRVGHPDALVASCWADLSSVDTGSPERDAHIRSPEFFDVQRFPRAELQSTSIELRDGNVIVTGMLGMHGEVREVSLEASPELPPANADIRHRMVFHARGAIDRQAFRLHWNQDLDQGGIVVGDLVEVTAHVVLVRESTDPTRTPRWS